MHTHIYLFIYLFIPLYKEIDSASHTYIPTLSALTEALLQFSYFLCVLYSITNNNLKEEIPVSYTREIHFSAGCNERLQHQYWKVITEVDVEIRWPLRIYAQLTGLHYRITAMLWLFFIAFNQ